MILKFMKYQLKCSARKSRNYSSPFASYMCFHMRRDLVPNGWGTETWHGGGGGISHACA